MYRRKRMSPTRILSKKLKKIIIAIAPTGAIIVGAAIVGAAAAAYI